MLEKIKNSSLFAFTLKASVSALISSALAFSLIRLLSCDQTPRDNTVLIELGSIPSYLAQIFICICLLFVFFSSIAIVDYFADKDDNSGIFRSNIKIFFRSLLTSILFTVIFFLFCAIFNLIFAKPIPVFSESGFFKIILCAVYAIPANMLIVAIELFFCRLFKNKKLRISMQITITSFFLFFSGCFFSIFSFSDMLNDILEYHPIGLCVSYYSRVITQYRKTRIVPEIIISALIIFLLSCAAGKILKRKKPTSDKKAFVTLICVTVCICISGGFLMSCDTAQTKIICLYDNIQNSDITERLNYYSGITCTDGRTVNGAKVNLCYGNCDAVYVFENGENTEIYQRENTPLLNRANRIITEAPKGRGINLIILSYYIIVAASFILSFFLACSPAFCSKKYIYKS